MGNTTRITRDQQIILIVIVMLFCLMAALSALLVYLLFARPRTPSQPTPVSDPSWTHIQATGRILVGTSADYPPFEYYDERMQLDGFDIALMREVGQKLGVEVVFQDIVFDSLGSSLSLGQIDAAISAITVTPERQATFAFSNVYYVGEDGVLARADSAIGAITSTDQLALWKVGVQSGSVYETWIQANLVDTGKMPAGNLVAYPRIDQAIDDLKAGTINLVVMDYLPAQDQVAQGGVKLVGRSTNPQNYAIMLRQGNNELLAQINNALLQLQNEGRIAQLAEIYLNVSPEQIATPPVPSPIASALPTSAPPPTVTPQGLCADGMVFVADLTYPDFNKTTYTLVPPNTPFQKGWRVRNTGTCTWNSSYVLRFVSGNHPAAVMGGVPTPIYGSVPPGGDYDLYINLVSPPNPGVYQATWALTNPGGVTFGQRLWVVIQVPQPGQPTQKPQVTGTVPPTRTVQPPKTVQPVAPSIKLFEIKPSTIVDGQCTYLKWDVTGTVEQVRILRNTISIWDTAPANYAITECPTGAGVITYEIQAIGPVGTDRASLQLTVNPR